MAKKNLLNYIQIEKLVQENFDDINMLKDGLKEIRTVLADITLKAEATSENTMRQLERGDETRKRSEKTCQK